MPTPVMHLALAKEILHGDGLPPTARRLVVQQCAPFLLGHDAADVQTVSGQARHETHFYSIPRANGRPAYQAGIPQNEL
jgi:hypothetical protein